MSDEIVGRDKLQGTSQNSDAFAKKMKARAAEAAREAAEEARGGGGNISVNVSGSTIGGSVTGRDQINQAGGDIVTGHKMTTTIGMSANDFTKAFDSIYQKIAAKPKDDQPAIKDAVDTIKNAAQAEATQGIKPDEKAVTAAAKSLAVDAPELLTDAADVVLATLANPAAGVIAIIRKIAEKVKASRGG
jgi:hypothetical protein